MMYTNDDDFEGSGADVYELRRALHEQAHEIEKLKAAVKLLTRQASRKEAVR